MQFMCKIIKNIKQKNVKLNFLENDKKNEARAKGL